MITLFFVELLKKLSGAGKNDPPVQIGLKCQRLNYNLWILMNSWPVFFHVCNISRNSRKFVPLNYMIIFHSLGYSQ